MRECCEGGELTAGCYHDNCTGSVLVDLFENGNLEHLMKTYDRFDLEAQIQKCWQVTDDIEELYKFVGDSPFFAGMDAKHEDTLMNCLIGLRAMYDAKFDSLWRMFEKMVEDEVIR